MISEFLIEINGRLKLNEKEILLYPEIPAETRKFLKPKKMRKNGELLIIY